MGTEGYMQGMIMLMGHGTEAEKRGYEDKVRDREKVDYWY